MIKELFRKGGPVVTDGGMGSSLIAGGASPHGCLEAMNVDAPGLVLDVHQRFVDVGAEVIWTNTFAANRYKLSRHGLEGAVDRINASGVKLARECDAVVAGSVGPLGVHLSPYGRIRPSEAQAAYEEQITALAEAGADLIAIETQFNLHEIELAVVAGRKIGSLPLLTSVTFTREDRTLLGASARQVGRRLVELGVDAVGINCSQGPRQARRLVAALREVVGDVPLVVRPNAGVPQQVGGRLLYPTTVEYFTEQAYALIDEGVAAVGGCCGTGAAHIKAVTIALRHKRVKPAPEDAPIVVHEASPRVGTPSSSLGSKLAARRYVVAVEMDPPRSSSADFLVAAAETLAEAGADAVTVADSPMARMRMSPWAVCRLIQEHAGLDAVLHFPTRGRNILRVQGDLLAAHALGIRTVFVCMGDPASLGDYPGANSAAEIVPTGLIALLSKSFNDGVDQSGASIGEPTGFTIGCALSPAVDDLERECQLLHRKIEAGADFALTQPVFSADVLQRFRVAYARQYGELTLPLVAGVLPLMSSRHAEFLHSEVPGITIPENLRVQLRKAGPASQRQGMQLALELIMQLHEEAGVYLMPPFGRYDLAAELVEQAAILHKSPAAATPPRRAGLPAA